jgi:hypothetical protein
MHRILEVPTSNLGLETRNSEDLHVSSAVFPEK